MLKLTIEAGEYVMIGNDIKVVFTGGTSHHARVLIDAPKTYKIVRSRALEKRGLHIDENTPIRYKNIFRSKRADPGNFSKRISQKKIRRTETAVIMRANLGACLLYRIRKRNSGYRNF